MKLENNSNSYVNFRKLFSRRMFGDVPLEIVFNIKKKTFISNLTKKKKVRVSGKNIETHSFKLKKPKSLFALKNLYYF